MRRVSFPALVFWPALTLVVVGLFVLGRQLNTTAFVPAAAWQVVEQQRVALAAADDARIALMQDFRAMQEERDALMTKRHYEALGLVRALAAMCERITFGTMIETGDRLCAEVIAKKEFPSRRHYLEILVNPEMAIQVGTEAVLDRCKVVEGEKPEICKGAEGWAIQ